MGNQLWTLRRHPPGAVSPKTRDDWFRVGSLFSVAALVAALPCSFKFVSPCRNRAADRGAGLKKNLVACWHQWRQGRMGFGTFWDSGLEHLFQVVPVVVNKLGRNLQSLLGLGEESSQLVPVNPGCWCLASSVGLWDILACLPCVTIRRCGDASELVLLLFRLPQKVCICCGIQPLFKLL